MRVPLRLRFGLFILPLVALQVVWLIAIVLPSVTIPGDLKHLDLELRQQMAVSALTRLLNAQAKECADFALGHKADDRRQLEDLAGRSRTILARWQDLRKQDAGFSPEETRVADELERDFGRINQLCRQIVEQAFARGNETTIGPIREQLVPLLEQVEGEEDRLIELESTEFSAGLANLSGRLGIVNLVTSGRFSRNLKAIGSEASRTFAANRFARRLSRELFLYASSATVGRMDRSLEAAQENTRDALADWRTVVETRNGGTPAKELVAVNEIERDYLRIVEAGSRLRPLVTDGRREETLALLAGEFEPVADRIGPTVDSVVAADASDLEIALSAISARLKFVLAVLGTLTLLGLAVALGGPVLILRKIIRPIVDLRGLANRLGAGELRVRAPVVSDDEVGELCAAFNNMAAELENRTREVRALAELGDNLQACMSVEEACRIVVPSIRALFAGDSGAVFVFAPSRDVLEPMVTWGETSPPASFAPDECWAVRRGRIQVVTGSGGPRCEHAGGSVGYLCSPMSAQGEMLGVLHLRLDGAAGNRQEWLDQKQRVAVSVADQFGLALANLRLRDTLRGLSIRDPLTGLFNRRYLEESLDRELRRAQRRGLPVAVLMLDIDHFKRFNDTFGHDAGDLVLKDVATVLRTNCRAEDIACRYGGEELTLILPEMPLEAAQVKAERLGDAIRRLRVRQGQQFLGSVTVSIGIAMFPAQGFAARDVLRAADAALYRAKECGRDRVEVA